MANVNTINFGPGASAADLQAQQMELQRRQQMIDMLKQQAMAQPEQQEVSGRVVPFSPWAGLAKLGQAYIAGRGQDAIDSKQLELGKQSSERYAKILQSLAPPGTFNDTPAPQGADAPLSSSPQMSVPQSPGAAQQPAAAADNPMRQKYARAIAAMQINPELGTALFKNLLTDTDEQKNMAAKGIDPQQMGRFEMAAAHKNGIIELQPGTTAMDLSNGQERFQPKLGEGIQLQNGVASAVPGYAGANAEIEGAKAHATAGAQAGYDMVKVDTPAGPVMMTRAQAAQQAGGGQPAAPIKFTASNGVSLDFTRMTPQQVYDAAAKSKDPAMLQAFNEWAGQGKPQMPGIQLQSDVDRERQLGQVRSEQEVEKNRLLAAQSPEAQQKLIDAGSVLSLLDMADPLLKDSTGSSVGALRDAALGTVGLSTKAGQSAAQLAAIGGALVSKMPKMSGPQSDKDVLLYKEMAGRIGDPSVPSATKAAAAKIIREINQKYLGQNANSVANNALKANQGGDQPSIDDLLKRYGGQ